MSPVPKRALLSVHDKTGVADLARGLVEAGWELVSSGGTASVLVDEGLPVTEVAQVTGAPEMLGGRVKTLHPAIHGGILADRSDPDHMAELEALGIVPIVRLTSPDPYLAASTVDDGALGIVAPYIETVEQVDGLRGAVKNRPLKGARLKERLAGKSVSTEINEYINERNADNVLIINIESQPAIDALDDLLATPEVDGVLIGPHDLSCNLGIPERYEAPEFLDAVQTIFDKAREHDRGAGMHFWGAVDQQVRFLEMGCNFMIHSADLLLVRDHLTSELNAIRKHMGDLPQSENGPDLTI